MMQEHTLATQPEIMGQLCRVSGCAEGLRGWHISRLEFFVAQCYDLFSEQMHCLYHVIMWEGGFSTISGF